MRHAPSHARQATPRSGYRYFVLRIAPWLVEDDVRWAWPRVVMHRVCDACGYGLAIVAGAEAVAEGVPGGVPVTASPPAVTDQGRGPPTGDQNTLG